MFAKMLLKKMRLNRKYPKKNSIWIQTREEDNKYYIKADYKKAKERKVPLDVNDAIVEKSRNSHFEDWFYVHLISLAFCRPKMEKVIHWELYKRQQFNQTNMVYAQTRICSGK